MAEFNPTADQQKAIEARGSVTVTAAAGSGKTAVLTHRVLQRITGDNAIDADRLLIVTFTNAAAEEMRNRIKEGMAKLLEKNPESSALLRQQALLSKAKITTIDSFCIGLVKDNFFKLNLPPDFKPAETGRFEAVKEEAINETFEEYYRQNDADFENMLSAFGDSDSDSKTVEALMTVYEYMCSLPFPFEWLNNSVKAYNADDPENTEWVKYLISDTKNQAEFLLKNIERVLAEVEMPDSYREKVETDRSSLQNICNALYKGNYEEIYFSARAFTNVYKETKSSKFSNEDIIKYNLVAARITKFALLLKQRFGCTVAELKEDIKLLLPVMTKFAEVLRSFDKCFMQKKAESGIYSFSDIERMALNLLVRYEDGSMIPTEEALSLSAQLEEVMVDEYQDTNDLQDTIFRVLSSNGKKLFTVGDAKQSIYRFRQANPENFINRINTCSNSEEGCVITLSENFRSRRGVCDFANFIFSVLMTEKMGDIDYNDNNHLVPSATYPEKTEPDIIADIIDTNGFTSASATGMRIAEAIKDMMGRECITDKDTGTLRKARYSDFAVLASKRKEFPEIAEVLNNCGIPTWTDDDPPLCDAKEVNWALSVLKIVCNPTLDVAFLSAMLCPAFGFTPGEAAEIKIKTGYCNTLYERVKKSAENGFEKSVRMLRIITELRKDLNSIPFDVFIHKMYEKTGLLAFVSALNGGTQRRANLIKLAELAAEYERFSGETGGFANYIEKSGKAILCPKTVSDADDVVKLMTVHRSKGLEFRVVFLASLMSSFNTTELTDRLLFDRRLGIGLKVTDRVKRLSYSPFCREAIIAVCERASKSESVRLLYVAVTRASEVLYMLFPTEKPETLLTAAAVKSSLMFDGQNADPEAFHKDQSFADMILPILLTHSDALSVGAEYSSGGVHRHSNSKLTLLRSVAEMSEDATDAEMENKSDPQTVELMKQKLIYKYPFMQLNGIASKYAVTSMIEKAVDREYFYSSRPEFESSKGLTPGERGTAMHKFLEVADFESASVCLEDEIERLHKNGFMSKKQADSLDRKKLNTFFKSDLYKRICNADNVYRELRFMTEEPAQSVDPTLSSEYKDEKVVIQGIADCVIEENGILTVIDYKTDRVNDVNELCNRYGEQLRIYSKCIEKCLKKRISNCIIYSLFKNESINLRKV